MTLMESLFGTTLITADNTWGLLGIMCMTVALSIWLEQTYNWASKVSGAISIYFWPPGVSLRLPQPRPRLGPKSGRWSQGCQGNLYTS